MKAIHFDNPNAPLYLGDAPEPELNPGDLLVRVHATALNRADLLQRRGGYAPPPGASSNSGAGTGG